MSIAANSGSIAALATIRGNFPALERRENGYPVAYFDGPGGTQVPRAVAEAMSTYLYHHNANAHWNFATSAETDATIRNGRAALADLLNAAPGEIVFGPNMSTLTFNLARALGRAYEAGDEILVTELDHHANVAPWQALERERGITLRWVRMVPQTGELDWRDLEAKLGPRTRLLAMTAASNALGTLNNVRRAAALAHGVGALLFADAVHSAPHLATDVRAWECDFLACSAYKFYGPHLGVLYGRKALLESTDFPKLAPAPNAPPECAETGTLNHEGIAGAAAAVDFLASLAASGATRRGRLENTLAGLEARGRTLAARLWEGLAAISGVRLFGSGPAAPRTPTVSFTVEGVASGEVARRLGKVGIFVSHGNFYAATIAERLGVGPQGFVRAGCACYTSGEEIERLIQGVRGIAGRAS